MTTEPDLDGRLRHLEEQMEALTDRVSEIGDVVHQFLGETANLHTEILAARRFASSASIIFVTNELSNWLLAAATGTQDLSRQAVITECREVLVPRMVRTKERLRLAENPEEVAREFQEGMQRYCEEHGLGPFLVE